MVHVGKYTSVMDPMGMYVDRYDMYVNANNYTYTYLWMCEYNKYMNI